MGQFSKMMRNIKENVLSINFTLILLFAIFVSSINAEAKSNENVSTKNFAAKKPGFLSGRDIHRRSTNIRDSYLGSEYLGRKKRSGTMTYGSEFLGKRQLQNLYRDRMLIGKRFGGGSRPLHRLDDGRENDGGLQDDYLLALLASNMNTKRSPEIPVAGQQSDREAFLEHLKGLQMELFLQRFG